QFVAIAFSASGKSVMTASTMAVTANVLRAASWVSFAVMGSSTARKIVTMGPGAGQVARPAAFSAGAELVTVGPCLLPTTWAEPRSGLHEGKSIGVGCRHVAGDGRSIVFQGAVV